MELINASKQFLKNNQKIIILDKVNIKFQRGKIYVIIGQSGVGKTTLINILGLLDKLDSGKILINDLDIQNCNDKELSQVRLNQIGMIFQDYYLNPRLNAKDNVLIATLINKNIKKCEREKIVNDMLAYFKLDNRVNHFPEELSGGEQQRVCIARALINNPSYVLADEPTGSLDIENAQAVMNILTSLAKEGKGVIIVTHDYQNLAYADYVYELINGKLIEVKKYDIYQKYYKKEKF